jgi:ParB family chromosome partitioning protein
MATRKKGLGRGLDSMIPNKLPEEKKETKTATKKSPAEEVPTTGGKIMLDINLVEPNRDQPRKYFDEDALLELSESVKEHGIVQPLLVQKKDDYYMIIAGERRWRAAKKAGLKEVPVNIAEGLSEQEILEIALIENIQREDLNPIEEALTYKRLLEEFHLKQDEVAERVSKSRTTVTNSMRLLKLDERVQQMIIDGMLTTGHARAILGIEDNEKQYEFAQRIFDEKLSVRDVEKEVKKLLKTKKTKNKENKIDPQMEVIYNDLADKMKNIFGTKVSVNPKDNKAGKIEIEYYSQDELNRIYEMLQTILK